MAYLTCLASCTLKTNCVTLLLTYKSLYEWEERSRESRGCVMRELEDECINMEMYNCKHMCCV